MARSWKINKAANEKMSWMDNFRKLALILEEINLAALPDAVPPCTLVCQIGGVWQVLTVPDTTKDYFLVFDSSSQTIKWNELTDTFTCP
jgi:hypothetical protein